MVCGHVDDVQAQVALRALLAPLRQTAKVGEDDDDHVYQHGPSLFHQRLVREMDAVLKEGLMRRVSRVEHHVNQLVGVDSGAASRRSTCVPEAASETRAAEVQTLQSCLASTQGVTDVLGKVYRKAAVCARASQKNYGPTRAQTKLTDPPEKKEDLVKESFTLNSTLQALKGITVSRERQNGSLRSQLAACEAIRDETSCDADRAEQTLQEVTSDAKCIPKVFESRLEARRARVAKLRKDVAVSEGKAVEYKRAAIKQQAYLKQTSSIMSILEVGFPGVIKRHAAGEVFVEARPPSLEGVKSETWDIGTAIANPYVVDSWPFEPNTQAQRTMNIRGREDDAMMPVDEESEKDEEDEEEDDEEGSSGDDDDPQQPPVSARSL